jgi:uncharacterized protein
MRVVFRKYDGSLHWHHEALLLGEDEHGVWVGCHAGAKGAKGDGPLVTWPTPFVLLFPREAWWVALFNTEEHSSAVYVDVTTVPEWQDDEVSMVDLDLDVVKRQTGEVYLDDVDEFSEHQLRYGYPPDVVTMAEETARMLMRAVADGAVPFDGDTHARWLAEVC